MLRTLQCDAIKFVHQDIGGHSFPLSPYCYVNCVVITKVNLVKILSAPDVEGIFLLIALLFCFVCVPH